MCIRDRATGANDPDKCLHVGYLNDGVKVYGFCKDSSGTQVGGFGYNRILNETKRIL